jgi:hypothetical protein
MHNAGLRIVPLEHRPHPQRIKGKPGLPFIHVIGIVSYCTTTFSGMLWTTFTVVFACDLV